MSIFDEFTHSILPRVGEVYTTQQHAAAQVAIAEFVENALRANERFILKRTAKAVEDVAQNLRNEEAAAVRNRQYREAERLDRRAQEFELVVANLKDWMPPANG